MQALIDLASPAATFAKLADTFKFDPCIATFLVEELHLEHLEDFQHLLTGEDQVESLITNHVAALEVPRRPLQASRVRRAWLGVRSAAAAELELKRKGDDSPDFDALLPQPRLDGLQESFWNRYHMAFPPEIAPCDALVSRLAREIEKRMLTVRDIWATRPLAHQLRTSRKRLKVAEHLHFTADEDDSVPPEKSIATYLALLHTLVLAYAMAGCSALVPPEGLVETRGSTSTDFVQVPLDVVMKYVYRAQLACSKMPAQLALPWLTSRDEAERTAWVEAFRNSSKPLGAVVLEVFHRRDAFWDVDAKKPVPAGPGPNATSALTSATQALTAAAAGIKAQTAGLPKPPAKLGPPKTVLFTLKNGTKLCPDWQKGKCKEPCPKNLAHQCGAVQSGNRVCGSRLHGASACDNKRVERK